MCFPRMKCCINLVKERVAKHSSAPITTWHNTGKPTNLRTRCLVLKSMGKGKAKIGEGKRKFKARTTWSNPSNQFVGFRLTSLMMRLTKRENFDWKMTSS